MALTIFITAVVLLALVCSKWDAETIAYLTRTGGGNLDHAPLWVFRACCIAIGAILCAHFMGCMWTALPLLGIGAFGFSAVFRWRLNRIRGLDWRYCSPSNWYDTLFIYVVDHVEWLGRYTEAKIHATMYANVDAPWYRDNIHRAGTIAYATELTITAACIVWAITLNA